MPQHHEIQTEENARQKRGEIADENIGRQRIRRRRRFEKKQAHSGDADDDGNQIRIAKFLLQNKRRQDQNVNRRRVLQKNRVRGGRRFIGVNKI